MPEQAEKRALLWCKVTDSAWRPADAAVAAADDVRVILPGTTEGPEYDELRAWLTERGVPYRFSRYWEEAEFRACGGRPATVVSTPLTGPVPSHRATVC